MKRYITLSCFFILLFSGMNNSFAQQSSKTSKEEMKQTILDNESAKDQAYMLHKIVGLEANQIPKIHEMFLELDTHKKNLIEIKDETGKAKLLDEIDSIKTMKLKEILTEAQYETYLKSFRKE